MKLPLLLALALAACAATPPTTSSAEQQVCMLDPDTGMCPVYIDPVAAGRAASELWADDNVQPDSIDNASCGSTAGNVVCQLSISLNGHSAMLYCTAQYTRLANGTIRITGVSCGAHAS